MVKVTCSKCGEEFEASSKRAKNCAECKDILQDAHRSGGYAEATAAIEETMANEALTPAQRREVVRAAAKGGRAAWQKKNTEIRAEQKARKEERKARQEARIKFYQEHGYWPVGEVADDGQGERYEIDGEPVRGGAGAPYAPADEA